MATLYLEEHRILLYSKLWGQMGDHGKKTFWTSVSTKVQNFVRLLSFVKIITSRRVRWAEQVARR
jgi:hypothetical protein